MDIQSLLRRMLAVCRGTTIGSSVKWIGLALEKQANGRLREGIDVC